MSHARQQIRDLLKAKLIAADMPTVGDRVLTGKRRPFERDHDPTVTIYTTPGVSGGQEMVARGDMGRRLDRLMMVTVNGLTCTEHHPDDLLDTIAAEIEVALDPDPTLGGVLIDEMTLHSTVTTVDVHSDRYEGGIRLVYEVKYSTRRGAPEVLS